MKRHSGSIFEQSHHMFDCYTHNLSHYEIYIRITTPGAFVIMKVKSNKAIYNMGAVYIQPFPSINMPLIKSRNFWLCVNICCSVPFLLQLFHVLNNFLDPSVTRFLLNFMFSHFFIVVYITSTVVEEKRLQDIEFPLVFKICMVPSFNFTAIMEAGYGHMGGYGFFRWDSFY